MDKSLSILITRFPFESVLSGEEWHTITLTEQLRQRGHSVAFMGSCHVLLEELGKRDIPVTRVPGGYVPVSAKNLALFLCTWPYLALRWGWQLRRLKKEHQLTTVYMHSLSEKLLLTPIARLLKLQVIWIEHQRWGKWMLGNPLRYIYKLWTPMVQIIGVSPLYKESFDMLGLPSARTHIVTNGIDLGFFHPDVEPLPLGSHGFHIGTVARLSTDKGVDILLEAFIQLCEKAREEQWPEELHLHLVGEGPLRESLEARAKTLPCGERVHLYVPYRTITRADAPRFMKALDIFVLPSALPDPFGLVAAESMATGTATVVTDTCGIRYQLHNEVDSIIIPANDIQVLTNSISALVSNPEQRTHIAAQGKETAQREFSIDTMISKYLEVFQTI